MKKNPDSLAPSYVMVPRIEYRASVLDGHEAEPVILRGGSEVAALLAPMVDGLPVERFYALYLNAKGRPLAIAQISEGTLTSSLVHPREVFAPALALRAAAIVVAHNHPSGDPEPSTEDRAATRRLVQAGRLLGVELLGHVVIASIGGKISSVSFMERGWL